MMSNRIRVGSMGCRQLLEATRGTPGGHLQLLPAERPILGTTLPVPHGPVG
jgi:hypothetical protein